MQTIVFDEKSYHLAAKLNLSRMTDITAQLVLPADNQAIGIPQRNAFSEALVRFSNGLSQFSNTSEEYSIAEAFGLTQFAAPQIMSALLTAVNNAATVGALRGTAIAPTLWQMHYAISSFLAAQGILHRLVVEGKVPADTPLLEITISATTGSQVTLDQAKTALTSLERMAEVIAQYLSVPPTLVIVYSDSGSPITTGFAAARELIAALKSILADGINYLRFYQVDGIDRRLKTLGDGVAFLSDVEARRQAGLLDDTLAATLKHTVVSELGSMYQSGLSPKDDSEQGLPSHSEVLAAVRENKQLPAPRNAE